MEETFETQLLIIIYINLKVKRFFHRREEETFICFQNNFRYGQSDDMSLIYSVRGVTKLSARCVVRREIGTGKVGLQFLVSILSDRPLVKFLF